MSRSVFKLLTRHELIKKKTIQTIAQNLLLREFVKLRSQVCLCE